MWCGTCSQDVPAVASRHATHQVVCVRCGDQLANTQEPQFHSVRMDTAHLGSDNSSREIPSVDLELETHEIDDWEWDVLAEPWTSDENLMRAKIAVNSYRAVSSNRQTIIEPSRRNTPNGTETNAGELRRRAMTGSDRRYTTPWVFAFPGITLFAFGGVLSAWSMVYDRADLWRIGLPTLLIGHAIVMLGLMFQLGRYRTTHRHTAQP